MRTEELSIFGYCCTGSVVSARQPTSTMTRLTTAARTGCLMKTSVKERMGFASARRVRGLWLRLLRHDDEDSLAQLERARGRDLLADREAGDDEHLVSEDRAALDLAQVRARFPRRVGREH